MISLPRCVSIILCSVVLTIGCGRGGNLPSHRMSGGPTATQDGVLVDQSGCVMLQSVSGRYLWMIIWPPGSVRQGLEIETTGGRLEIGQTATLGGGESTDYELVRSQVGGDLDPACRVERYWLATEAI